MELRGDRGHNTARLLEQFRCIMERNLNLTFSDEKINEFGPGRLYIDRLGLAIAYRGE